MPTFRALCGIASIAIFASPALAQTPASQEQKPSMEELMRRLDALQARATEGDKLISALRHRVDELETRDKRSKSQATTARRDVVAPTTGQKPPAILIASTAAVLPQAAAAAIPGPASARSNGKSVRRRRPGRVAFGSPGSILAYPWLAVRGAVLRFRQRPRVPRLQWPQSVRCADCASHSTFRKPRRHPGR